MDKILKSFSIDTANRINFWPLLTTLAVAVGVPCLQFGFIYPLVYHYRYENVNPENWNRRKLGRMGVS